MASQLKEQGDEKAAGRANERSSISPRENFESYALPERLDAQDAAEIFAPADAHHTAGTRRVSAARMASI
jgi:hypothetical protein